MQTLGQGAQYKVTAEGDRVFKSLITLDESVAIYRKWGYGFITRDLTGLADKTLKHAATSLQGIRKILEAHPELASSLANPVIDENSNYTQDKVTVLGEALKTSSRRQAKEFIDQYIDLQFHFASYGFADPILQVGVNYGVDKHSKVVLIDLGEVTFEKEAALEAAAAKKWRIAVTYWVPQPYPMKQTIPVALKPYYRKQMLFRFTPAAIATNWLKKE